MDKFVCVLMLAAFPALGQSLRPQSANLPFPSDLSDETLATLRAQEPLVQAADEITELIATSTDYLAGFASVELDVPTRTVKIFWKKSVKVPSLLERLVARQKVSVVLIPSAFSADELRQRIDSFVTTLRDVGAAWSGVFPTPGGSGITVMLPTASKNLRLITAKGAELERLSRELMAVASLPALTGEYVTVEYQDQPVPFSRAADSPPWWGGAQINALTGCSSGFAIGDVFGFAMLTAAHCCTTVAAGQNVTNGAGSLMGVSAHNGLAGGGTLDTVRINGVSSVQGVIYDGTPGVSEFAKSIKGYGTSSYVGLWLCTSGAFSGARCNIVVDAVNVTTPIFFGSGTVTQLARANENSGANAAGQGDSGGPVFSLRDNNVNATAQGTISLGFPTTFPATCTGILSVGGDARRCSSRILYQPIKTILDFHAAFIITN